MKRHLVTLSALFILIVFLIAWSTYSRFQQFTAYHGIIADHATHSVANNAQDLVQQRERLIAVMVQQNIGLIRHILLHPDDGAATDRLHQQARAYFPDYITLTVTDAEGTPVLEDIESLMGDVCLLDLQDYMTTGTHLQRVHPSSHAYHFDVFSPFVVNRSNYIFLASFHGQAGYYTAPGQGSTFYFDLPALP